MLGSIILINFNTAQLSLDAIDTITKQTTGFNENYELIIVDNASIEIDFLNLRNSLNKLNLSNLKLVRSRINSGFGGGNMLGVQEAKGDYYIFINSDALLIEDSFNKMINFLKENSHIAMLGAQSKDGNDKISKPFDYRIGLRKELFSEVVLHALFPKTFIDRKQVFTKPTRVGAIPGSLMVCRAADFDAVGGFDTNLFLYYEEKDVSYRLEKIGKHTYSFPGTIFIHLKGKSTASTYAIKQELKISQFYSFRKNLGAFKYCIFYTASLFKFMFKSPFSSKNRKLFMWTLRGASLAESLKHKQQIQPYIE